MEQNAIPPRPGETPAESARGVARDLPPLSKPQAALRVSEEPIQPFEQKQKSLTSTQAPIDSEAIAPIEAKTTDFDETSSNQPVSDIASLPAPILIEKDTETPISSIVEEPIIEPSPFDVDVTSKGSQPEPTERIPVSAAQEQSAESQPSPEDFALDGPKYDAPDGNRLQMEQTLAEKPDHVAPMRPSEQQLATTRVGDDEVSKTPPGGSQTQEPERIEDAEPLDEAPDMSRPVTILGTSSQPESQKKESLIDPAQEEISLDDLEEILSAEKMNPEELASGQPSKKDSDDSEGRAFGPRTEGTPYEYPSEIILGEYSTRTPLRIRNVRRIYPVLR